MEEAVLDAATEMLRAGGPDALTMARLAAELELSVGGLYRYYPGKGAILVGLEKRAIASYRAVQEDLLATLEPRFRGGRRRSRRWRGCSPPRRPTSSTRGAIRCSTGS